MSDSVLVWTDSAKLRTLADWFDKYDDECNPHCRREVQSDLRRIARHLDEMASALIVPLDRPLWELGDHRGNIIAACQDLITDWFAE